MPTVEFIKVREFARMPTKATDGAVGFDLRCMDDFRLLPGERKLVDTGLKIAVETGYEAQIRPRSGLALNCGVTVLNAPGTVDPDYRGGLGVILVNTGDLTATFRAGDRIAQLVIKPVCKDVTILEVKEFSEPNTKRGEGGYGSTGSQ